jgi:hypothetical protein
MKRIKGQLETLEHVDSAGKPAIDHIAKENDRQSRAAGHGAVQDVLPSERLSVGPAESLVKLDGRHSLGLDHNVHGVVLAPVVSQDASLFLKPLEELRPRIWSVQGISGNVDLQPLDLRRRGCEDVSVILVEAEYEATLDDDASLVEAVHHLAIVFPRVESLVDPVERSLADRLKTEQQILAATPHQ